MLGAIVIIAAIAGWRWADARAAASTDRFAEQTATGHAGLLASELQKFRLLPVVLAEYPDVLPSLNGNRVGRARLDVRLEQLAERTDAAAIYVIDAAGTTVAASNWRTPASFAGQNYGFRPYFRDAIRHGASELFALGTVSGRPGLYLARRIGSAARPLGVIVVKVEFDRVEANWAGSPGMTIVVDPHGIVLVTSEPRWRFEATRAIDPRVLAQARRTLQFGASTPHRAPLMIDGRAASVIGNGDNRRYRIAAVAAPLADARLLHLAPLDPALAAARMQVALWLLAALVVIGVGAGLTIRGIETRRFERLARGALEDEVVRRTADLSAANASLIVESNERAAAERRFRAAREELAQANRLGTLGQITAGVAHEIAQPVAAIRTFAENGRILLDRAAPERARDNLSQIVGLTERIGAITAELRAFSRRKTPARGDIALGAVIEGTLLILGERARGIVSVEMAAEVRHVTVEGDQVRLEQILINLLQNALDATAGVAQARATIVVTETGDTVAIAVADNGPGVDPALLDTLFTPFTSAKPNGLGLGLAIARDIARDVGGDLIHVDSAVGATFRLTVRRAA